MTGGAVSGHAFWLASRAAGVVALALVSASVLIGIATAHGSRRAPGMRRALSDLHRQVALTALAAIAVHALLLLGDPWLRPGLRGIAIPFALAYRPQFTGLGVVAAGVAALLGLSFYARRRIGARRWRRLHRLVVAAYALALVHAVGAGSDAGTPWLTMIVVAPGVLLAALLAAQARARRAARAVARP